MAKVWPFVILGSGLTLVGSSLFSLYHRALFSDVMIGTLFAFWR